MSDELVLMRKDRLGPGQMMYKCRECREHTIHNYEISMPSSYHQHYRITLDIYKCINCGTLKYISHREGYVERSMM